MSKNKENKKDHSYTNPKIETVSLFGFSGASCNLGTSGTTNPCVVNPTEGS